MRLDALLHINGYYPSRTKACEAINDGRVLYKGKPAKPSISLDSLEDITVLTG